MTCVCMCYVCDACCVVARAGDGSVGLSARRGGSRGAVGRAPRRGLREPPARALVVLRATAMCASPLEPKKFEFYLITTDHLRQCVKLSTGTALSCGAAAPARGGPALVVLVGRVAGAPHRMITVAIHMYV